ncbi:BCCT family transporter [Nesterenkonia aerolata]|uniref:BCCT family transporter n=1 Tax=Nesterenkonia aerolata TaxID=3074079 RepID=A0ABU2DVL1_9MICC|nr:BCCT family transporter [Nesterenkonia sp. LY-0111]MDR8020320.1 BCCT family transporter [Nesterenkonia sp. LY-0111]
MAAQPEAEVKHWSPASVWRGLSKPVFIPAVVIIGAALVFATWFSSQHGDEAFENLNTAIVDGIGWWYVLIVTAFVVFAIWVGVGKTGQIRLGRDDEQPEFSVISWFTMLFAAGMGIGLVFWGVAEPLNHLIGPPDTTGEVAQAADGTALLATEGELSRNAVGATLFHWGLHAWAIYVVVGLGLAYMTFRRGRPLAMRWLLEPIFGRRLIESWVGHVIDIVAIVGTIFGIVTSLGQGVQQIVAGLIYMGWAEESTALLNGLIIVITAIALFSVITGVYKGLKWLSNVNMLMAAVLALFVMFSGPTLLLLSQLVSNTGEYLITLPQMAFETSAGYAGGEGSWSADWTIYYWGWWMSWAPFVGMFIARISRGRTIREFVFGVLLAPTVIAIFWFTVFGSSGIWYQINEGGMLNEDGGVTTEDALFNLLEAVNLPLLTVTAAVAIVVVTIFFITSADSGSLVVDVLANGGRADTPRLTRVFWVVLIAVAAIVLLNAGTDSSAALRVLQVSSISAAAPLSIVLVLTMIALIKVLNYEAATMPRYVRIRRTATPAALVDTAREVAGSDDDAAVTRSLRSMLSRQRRVFSDALGGLSATLGGLSSQAGRQGEKQGIMEGEEIYALHEVPAHATQVNPETGTLGWDEEEAYHDPIETHHFDTPEYAESAVGWEHEQEQLFEDVVSDASTSGDAQPNISERSRRSDQVIDEQISDGQVLSDEEGTRD